MRHLKHPLKISALLCAFALSACNTMPKAPEKSAVVDPAYAAPAVTPAPMQSPTALKSYGSAGMMYEADVGYQKFDSRSRSAPKSVAIPDYSKFNKINDNVIEQTSTQPVSTFSLDVDTSS
jgi:hypothetical protein